MRQSPIINNIDRVRLLRECFESGEVLPDSRMLVTKFHSIPCHGYVEIYATLTDGLTDKTETHWIMEKPTAPSDKREPNADKLAELLREALPFLLTDKGQPLARKINDVLGPAHAPLPYSIGAADGDICDAEGRYLGAVRSRINDAATAEFIVKACNEYDGLVEQVRQLQSVPRGLLPPGYKTVSDKMLELAQIGFDHLVERWGRDDPRLEKYIAEMQECRLATESTDSRPAPCEHEYEKTGESPTATYWACKHCGDTKQTPIVARPAKP